MERKQLTDYDPNRYNILLPTRAIQQINPWYAYGVTVVHVDPNPESGDVYPVGSRRVKGEDGKWYVQELYGLAKPALMRMMQAAGIVWNFRESGVRRLDRDYVLYVAIGAIRLADGTWMTLSAHKEIDLEVEEAVLREQWQARAERLARQGNVPEDERYRYKVRKAQVQGRDVFLLDEAEIPRYVEEHVRSAMLHKRKNKVHLAETGAMLRLVRSALAIKAQYTAEELRRPFVVPRVDFQPDLSDPEVRRAMIQHGLPAIQTLFGGPFSALPPSSPPPAVDAHGDGRASVVQVLPSGSGAGKAQQVIAPPTLTPDDEDDPLVEPPPLAPDEDEPVVDELADDGDGSDPDPDPPAAAAAVPAQQQVGVSPGAVPCAACGRTITSPAVVEYARKTFGRDLCYGCQQRERAARRKQAAGGGA